MVWALVCIVGRMTTLYVERTDDGAIHHTDSVPAQWLGEGDVEIAVSHSSLNYKDAMALAGDKGVMRISPLVPGIDAVGTVTHEAGGFKQGQLVTCNGAGLGEFRHGGYTSLQRVPAESTVAVPEGLTAEQAAAVGTAGYTAALCVNALCDHGLASPSKDVRVLVTGATGGVGSIAVNLLHQLGYHVIALTGRVDEQSEYLRSIGADEILDRAEVSEPGRPLQKARFDAVVDTLGGVPLANLIAQVKWGGVVASTGLASSPQLDTTVLPFILRNVTLTGVNSVDAPKKARERAWQLIASTLNREILSSMTDVITLDDVADKGQVLLDGAGHGRTVVEIN